MRNIILGVAAIATATTALPGVAAAHDHHRGRYHSSYDRGYDRYDDDRYDREDGRYARYYTRSGYYNGPTWRGRDGRQYCRRSDGTTGLIIGGVAGALVGRSIDTHGDRAAGTLLGGAIGALLGQGIDKDHSARRCR